MPAEARTDIDEALRLAPQVPFTIAVSGLVDEKEGRMSEARDAYNRALAIEPNLALAKAGLDRIAGAPAGGDERGIRAAREVRTPRARARARAGRRRRNVRQVRAGDRQDREGQVRRLEADDGAGQQQVEIVDRRVGDGTGCGAAFQLAQREIAAHVPVRQIKDHGGAIDALGDAATPDVDVGSATPPNRQRRSD